MTQEANALVEAINKLVEQNTFSLDAVEAIKKLRDTAAAQAKELEHKASVIQLYLDEKFKLQDDVTRLKAEVEALKSHSADVATREAMVAENEKKAAVAEAVAGAYKDAMQIVFKPNTVRESVLKQENLPYTTNSNGNYSGYSNMSASSERVVQEGA